MKNVGVILAGGTGSRFNSAVPKYFVKLNGVPIIKYVIEEMERSQIFDNIIVTLPSLEWKKYAYGHDIVAGDTSTRNGTIQNVLNFLSSDNINFILFHDAVRPLIKAEDYPQYFKALETHLGVVTAEKITDSLYPVEDRSEYRLIQTPEAFRYTDLVKVFDRTQTKKTAIYQHFPNKEDIALIQLSHPNYKVTYQYDLFMLEHLVKYFPYQKNYQVLKDKKVLLLGGSGDIGQAVQKILKDKAGCEVFAPAHETIDLSDSFWKALVKKYPAVDIIINTAGVLSKDSEGILNNYDKVMSINFKANLQLIEYAKAIKSNKRSPINIVMVSSSSATKGRPNFTLYSASKVAVHSLVESLADELARNGIYLNCICPEKVDTKMTRKNHENYDVNELLQVEEVANAILETATLREAGKIIYLKKGFYSG